MNYQSLILSTKLQPPRLAHRVVERQNLAPKFAMSKQTGITLVSAPAGYGKTTAVSLWLNTVGHPYVWLSLDRHDNDLLSFVSYLAAAIKTVFPRACPDTTVMVNEPINLHPFRLGDVFLRDLAALGDSFVFVLDDYHAIENADIHAFMIRLVNRLPGNIHITIITRLDPPLPLARLRVAEKIAEIRSADLRFTFVECDELLSRNINYSLSPYLIERIRHYTEGWPAALQLMVILMQNSLNPSKTMAQLERNLNRLFTDYLLDEVYALLDPPSRRLLARLAIFERISAELVELVKPAGYEAPEGEPIIDFLWHSNFFLSSLDASGTWYRFHHLVRTFFLNCLMQTESEATVQELHFKASQWFIERGLHSEAIAHASLCGDDTVMLHLVEPAVYDAIANSELGALEIWLGVVPEHLGSRPSLLLARANLHRYWNNYGVVADLVDEAAEGLKQDGYAYSAEERRLYTGMIHFMQAEMAQNVCDFSASIQHAKQALIHLPSHQVSIRSLVEFLQLNAMFWSGRHEESSAYIRAELHRSGNNINVRILTLMMMKMSAEYEQMNLTAMAQHLDQIEYVANKFDRPIFHSWAHLCRGFVHYQRNELSAALILFAKVVAKKQVVPTRIYLNCVRGMIFILCLQGKRQGANRILADLCAFARERGLANALLIAQSLTVHLQIRFPDGSDKNHAFPLAMEPMDARNLYFLEAREWPAATAIRLLLHNGTEADLKAAQVQLDQCRALVEKTISYRHMIILHLLSAKLEHQRGKPSCAFNEVRQAVQLAAPGGSLRIIADDAVDLYPYLVQMRETGESSAYINEVLAVLDADAELRRQTRSSRSDASDISSCSPPEIRQNLTFRESEVLNWIVQGLANKEIANQLSISSSTVRKHTINIYRKLQVENRTQAAARARQLN